MIDLSQFGIESIAFKEQRADAKSILGVFAHPDDESFGPGATLAKYAAQGVAVHVLTATDGDAGDLLTALPDGVHTLAELRTRELECAVEHLGATALHRLGYRDSGMEGTPANKNPGAFLMADREVVIRSLVAAIRGLRPTLVLTHDQTGAYFHPDHIRCWELVTAAFERAGDASYAPDLGDPYRPQFLYYTALPKSRVQKTIWMARLFRKDPTKWGRNGDIDLTRLGIPESGITARVDVRPYLQTRLEAGACHLSQGGSTKPPSLWARVFQRRIAGVSGWDNFIQAYPPPPARNGRKKPDLFND